MPLSRSTIDVISDLIENRLSNMTIGDQDDLREKLVLGRALEEVRSGGLPAAFGDMMDIPRRGRRRKVAGVFA